MSALVGGTFATLHPDLPSLSEGTSQASLQWEWFAASWPSFPYPSCFHGYVSCTGDRAVPGKGLLTYIAQGLVKAGKERSSAVGMLTFAWAVLVRLLHKAAAFRMCLLELATAGSEVWAWTKRGLSCCHWLVQWLAACRRHWEVWYGSSWVSEALVPWRWAF